MDGFKSHTSGFRGLLAGLVVLVATSGCATMSVSPRQEIQMGRDLSDKINRNTAMVEDPSVVDPLQEIGRQMVENTRRPNLPWEFRVVNRSSLNAFAVPGGFLYFHRGVLTEAQSMHEVVGVLAHEIAHITARHTADQLKAQRTAGLLGALGAVASDVLLDGVGKTAAQAGVVVGTGLALADYSRSQEAEADSIAVHYMVENGWDPRGLTSFFKTLKNEHGDTGGGLFGTHPVTSDRIQMVQRIINRYDEARLDSLKRTHDGFGRTQAVLAELPEPRR